VKVAGEQLAGYSLQKLAISANWSNLQF